MPTVQVPVDIKNEAFECPNCSFPSQQHRYSCLIHKYGQPEANSRALENPLTNKHNSPKIQSLKGRINCTECEVCGYIALWIGDNLIFPFFPQNISKPNQDMPEEIKIIYVEAAEVSSRSPRSAAALLRLCLEMLLDFLEISGKTLSDKIGNSKFPEKILMACDVVRVHGNHAVHPREIQDDDKAETVATLFYLVNYIIEIQITSPKKIEEIFDSLTAEQKDKIKKRNDKH